MDNRANGSGPGPAISHRVIIRRKLAVPTADEHVEHRRRVTDSVRRLLTASPILVVSATAGSGKTTALTGALHGLDRPVAWLSLDGTEAAAGRLLVYLEAAVEGQVPEAGQVATDALHSGIPLAEAAGLLAESLFGSGLVLVCDNVERIDDSPEAVAVLSSFARYLPDGVNLVLLSRTTPALDAGSTRELGRVARLEGTELAFDEAEAGLVLQRLGRNDVDPAEVVRMTGGWGPGAGFGGWGAPDAPDRDG